MPPEPSTNRLADETSPYLLQHARNPVDWHPWSPEAFAEARRRGVPVFLSIGYSTCYWCHVMERESFESDSVARVMNDGFVCIKVDREERPDIDDIYMTAVQAIAGRGGWPMSVWLTPPGARGPDDPGLEPFYAGTYFPKEPRHGLPSFPELMTSIASAWRDQRDRVLEQARSVTNAVRESLARATEPAPTGAEQVGQALGTLLQLHDHEHGGFGPAPKFPQPVYLRFILDIVNRIEDPAVGATAERAVRLTLDRMATGGLFDQVGGGFHRYSVDATWTVPHFEKMLYDNALLVSAYAQSYARSRDPFDARVVRRTLEFVERELTHADGGFFSALDAEVNHREGLNYLWTRAQLDEALGPDDGAFAARVYGVDRGPNFRDPHHPGDEPTSVLHLVERPDRLARDLEVDESELLTRIDAINRRLLEARDRRERPALDDKVITAWNGLMIAAYADAAAALNDPIYLERAERAAEFVLTRLRAADGPLFRSWRAGRAGTPAFLDDYAMLTAGILALHRARASLKLSSSDHLSRAADLVRRARALFTDDSRPGVWFDTREGQPDLIVRTSATYDGAIPAGASVMLNNLMDLHELTGDRAWLDQAVASMAALSRAVRESPVGSINATRALARLLRADRARVESIAPPADDLNDTVRVDEAPVQVFSSGERLTVTPNSDATLPVELRIARGFHIAAADPGIEGLTGLSVRVEGGTGVEAHADFPRGTPYTGAALPPEEHGHLLVYSDSVRFDIRLRRTADPWRGRPLVLISYQPCDDSACFQPITVELDVALDPG